MIQVKKAISTLIFGGFVLMMSSCSKDSEHTISVVEHDVTPYVLHYGSFPPPPIAIDNKLTVQGVKLGRMLFYETMLSKDGKMACASCHRQEHAFSDTNQFSIGVEGLPGKRQAMGIFNMAWNINEFFWDGRAHLLRDQSLKPIEDELEMAEDLDNVILKLADSQTYKDQFKRAFGSEEITSVKMSLAMEQFMNTIVSYESKYDGFLVGTSTLTDSEERGRALFFLEFNPSFPNNSGADCAHCHSGFNFSNNKYANNGLESDATLTDLGRGTVTNNPMDKGSMKVTSLRNIAVTGPYMHDGRFTTLEQVVDHYNTGLEQSSSLDPALVMVKANGGLGLSVQDKADLVAFLKTLTDGELLSDEAFSDPNK